MTCTLELTGSVCLFIYLLLSFSFFAELLCDYDTTESVIAGIESSTLKILKFTSASSRVFSDRKYVSGQGRKVISRYCTINAHTLLPFAL